MLNTVIYDNNLNILPKIKRKSVDLILTDAPYLISKSSNFKKSDNKKFNKLSNEYGEWDTIDLNWDLLFIEFHRVLKSGGKLIIFYDIWKFNSLKEYAIKYKFSQPRIGIWSKTNPMPLNSQHNYLNSQEFFIVLTKTGWKGRSRAESTFNSEYDTGIYNYPTVSRQEALGHTTQKPIKLIEDLILKHSNEDEVILDPFIGSGTTGEACVKTKRNFIGIESDIESIEMCKKRGLNIWRER